MFFFFCIYGSKTISSVGVGLIWTRARLRDLLFDLSFLKIDFEGTPDRIDLVEISDRLTLETRLSLMPGLEIAKLSTWGRGNSRAEPGRATFATRVAVTGAIYSSDLRWSGMRMGLISS